MARLSTPAVGRAYVARVSNTKRAYVYVVMGVRGDKIQVGRGWFRYVDKVKRPSGADEWTVGRTWRLVPSRDFKIVRALGVAPTTGGHRVDYPWAGEPLEVSISTSSRQSPATSTWSIEEGDLVARRKVHDAYGGNRQGGIAPSAKTPNVLIFSDPGVGHQHGYDDWWDGRTLHYFGEGQTGNQTVTRGNAAILNHSATGRALRVFAGAKGEVRYLGEYALGTPPFMWRSTTQRTGGVREAIVFQLSPTNPKARLIAAGASLSDDYKDVPERRRSAPARASFPDPDKTDRSSNMHAHLQNLLARHMRGRGARVLRPRSLVWYDIAWELSGRFTVAEVKSLTAANEITQLRLGLGQVLHYQHVITKSGRNASAVLFVEREPASPVWLDLCRDHGVKLLWPEVL